MAEKVFLSPSDHGVGANKCLHSGCYEDKHTRPIAEACARYLEQSGVEVMIGTANQSLKKRCQDSDDFGADLHVPIHTNAWSDPNMRYLMFMFYADNSKYRNAFNDVAPELEAVYPGNVKSKFAVRTDLTEVVKPKALTIYCELGFHTNQTDCDKFIHNAEMVGKALAKGICKYLGVAFKDNEQKKEEEQIYRVRTSWDKPSSQTGAYKSLENAKKMCGVDYTVYDKDGKAVYTNKAASSAVDGAQSFNKAKAGTYVVTATSLNLRSGASTNKQIIETMAKGKTFTCYGYYTGEWLYGVSASGKNGFCHKSYLKKK